MGDVTMIVTTLLTAFYLIPAFNGGLAEITCVVSGKYRDFVDPAGDGLARTHQGLAAKYSGTSAVIQMGLRGSIGVRQDGDVLLYSTAVRLSAEKGQQKGYALSYHTNATIDHYHWEYVGDDGYTAEFQIAGGGLGYKFIALCLSSQGGHGIFYNISIYGSFEDQLRRF